MGLLHVTTPTTAPPVADLLLQNAADQVAANWHSIASGQGPLAANLVDKVQGY